MPVGSKRTGKTPQERRDSWKPTPLSHMLEAKMKEQGLTLTYAEAEWEINRQTIREIIRGKTSIDLETIVRLSGILDVSVPEILNMIGIETNEKPTPEEEEIRWARIFLKVADMRQVLSMILDVPQEHRYMVMSWLERAKELRDAQESEDDSTD